MSSKFLFTSLLIGIFAAGCATPAATAETVEVPQPSPTPEPQVVEATQFVEPQVLFQAFPVAYQDIKIPMYLQEKVNLKEADVLQLPADTLPPKEEVFKVVQDDNYLDRFNFDLLAEYSEETHFIAVPAKTLPENPDWVDKGVMVGLVYDSGSFYAKSEIPVYEVYFFNDRAELRDKSGWTVAKYFLNEGYFLTESVFKPEVMTFFIKNGCWLCWQANERCGCLICF